MPGHGFSGSMTSRLVTGRRAPTTTVQLHDMRPDLQSFGSEDRDFPVRPPSVAAFAVLGWKARKSQIFGY